MSKSLSRSFTWQPDAGTYIVAVYHLEDRAYYAHIATIDTSELRRTISNVLLYAGLEFASLMFISIPIYRRMRITTLRQLSFVLERQSNLVQTKLLTWFSFTVQNSLDHFGKSLVLLLPILLSYLPELF
uniref:Uncharacterized protein n=1 Tax=Globisporangium ultimum (strain ATCC 200006 / CBS 805.95 / DAOM BR144) TaxID=431595 RepID=K3X6K5_GLOUD